MEAYNKTMAAAALIRDDMDALLIVKPSYRDGWLLPGGMVESGESPKRACQREIYEEVGLELSVGRLLCVDYEDKDWRGAESLKFVFDGGVLAQAQTASVTLQKDELSDHAFVPTAEAIEKLNYFLSRRVRHALAAQQTGQTYYLENQKRF